MEGFKKNSKKFHILIVGSGIIGKFNALQLSEQGFQITIADPQKRKNSSSAALGLLFGNMYQKNKGRSWELRKKSIELWPKWLKEFNELNPKLVFEKPLIQMTTDENKFEKMKNFVLKHPNDNLEILDENFSLVKNIHTLFGTNKIRGIISHNDGRIDPKLMLNTIDKLLEKQNIKTIKDEVIKIKKEGNDWISILKGGNIISSKVIILCNSLNTLNLIESNLYNIRLQPVLGQAVEILNEDDSINFLHLPKVMSINGKNIIPISKNKIIIGSTDENDLKPKEENITELTNFLEQKPEWLNSNKIIRKWFGIRSRPIGEPSPLMKSLEDGLILCAGFYKNGILLAPACSNWVSKEIRKFI